MVDYNVSLGKGKETQKLSSSDMKGGVRKDDIKDEKMKSIFSMLDTNNNGILENEEITKINNAISQFAQEDGDVSNLSKKEAKQLIAKLGLKGIKTSDLFKFLKTIKSGVSNIVSQTVDTDGSKAIDVEYKADDNGNKVTKQYDSKTGNLTGSYTVDKDGNEFWQDANGKVTKGKDEVGNYTRKYNDDGSYIDTYENNKGTKKYTSNGLLIGGSDTDGTEYQRVYNWGAGETGYTDAYTDGRIRNYDTNGRWISGMTQSEEIYINTYNDNGSYISTWDDGMTQEYDKNGKELSGKLADGTTYEAKYNDHGELKYKEYSKNDGSKYYWGADAQSYAEKTANGSLKVNPKQGETFNKTMERLGITDPSDQELFIKSNPKAYKRGYFLLADAGKAGGDVYIPKAIADKLDINNVLVDETAEMEKHKQARKTPSMGI